MSGNTIIPIVFLAFADSEEQGHLPALKKESKELYDLLLPLKKTGQIDLLREHHTDNETIPKRFTDFNNQICIFHYGGHADGKHLFFENKKGRSQGLGELLSMQRSLQLVFLNGCQTQEQARQYVKSDIPAVIATTRAVPDDDALYFATCFYRALAERLNLKEAFKTASAALKTRSDLYPEEEKEKEEKEEKEEEKEIVISRGIELANAIKEDIPWRMYVEESRKEVLDWRIPETVPGEHKVTYELADSNTYQEIRTRIDRIRAEIQNKQGQLTAFPDSLPESLLSVRKSIELEQIRLGEQLEFEQEKEKQLKKQIIELAKTFDRIKIDTQRLKKAKAYFDKGKFLEADAVLKTEEMVLEKDQLLDAKEKKERELKKINQELNSKAEEFLIKAKLTISLMHEKANWFEEARQHFEHSLQSNVYFDNLLSYADFLLEQKQFLDAIPLYQQSLELELTDEQKATTLNNLAILHKATTNYTDARQCYDEALQIYRQLAEVNPQAFWPDVATTLNNLANLHSDTTNYTDACQCYDEALQIRRQLAEVNPQAFGPDVAMTLNNLGLLHFDTTNYTDARQCYDEALQIYRQLTEVNPQAFLPYVAATLNNLANLHRATTNYTDARQCYDEALQIYRQLAEVNPHAFGPDVAMTLNNLGLLHSDTTNYTDARQCYDEALQIRRQLAEVNPQAFGLDLAMTLINIGIFFQEDEVNRDLSLTHIKEAGVTILPFLERVLIAQKYLQIAKQVLQAWGINSEEDLEAFLEEE